MKVHAETFKTTGSETLPTGSTVNRHSIEVTINGRRRVVACSGVWDGRVEIFGLAVRFSQGAKVWPGSADYWIDTDRVGRVRPNIDKRGHVHLVGFFADFKDTAVRSQHNAVA